MVKTILLLLLLIVVKHTLSQENTGINDSKDPKEGQVLDLELLLYRPFCAIDWDSSQQYGSDPARYDSIAAIINSLPGWIIHLESHTDCRQNKEYNLKLSQKRADDLRKQLLPLLKDTTQLIAVGRGEEDPRMKKCACEMHDYGNKICNEEEHQLNRRTLLRLIKKRRE